MFISRKWKKFYGNWAKLNESFRKLFIFDLKHRAVNRKTFKWFYGFMCASLLVFFLNITRGITASCWDDYDFKSFDKVLFKTTYTEFFKGVPYHISLGIYFMVVDFHCAIAWSFNDLFIVCISIWLERNFTIFNERIAFNIRVNNLPVKNYLIKIFSHFRINQESFGTNILICIRIFVIT